MRPWKTIGHLFYATSSFVHNFLSIGEFKLELQSGNAQFGSNSTIFSRATLKFGRWPWKTVGHLSYPTSSFVHYFVAIGEFKLELQSRNAQSGSNSTIFTAVWPWNFMDDLEKQQGTSSKQHQAICIISSSYVNPNWSYSPETVKMGHGLCDLDLWPLTWPFSWTLRRSLVITPENFMMIRWWEHSQKGVTDRPTKRCLVATFVHKFGCVFPVWLLGFVWLRLYVQTHKTVSCGYFCP